MSVCWGMVVGGVGGGRCSGGGRTQGGMSLRECDHPVEEHWLDHEPLPGQSQEQKAS